MTDTRVITEGPPSALVRQLAVKFSTGRASGSMRQASNFLRLWPRSWPDKLVRLME